MTHYQHHVDHDRHMIFVRCDSRAFLHFRINKRWEATALEQLTSLSVRSLNSCSVVTPHEQPLVFNLVTQYYQRQRQLRLFSAGERDPFPLALPSSVSAGRPSRRLHTHRPQSVAKNKSSEKE